MKKIIEDLLFLLRVRATASGLEISDRVLRAMSFNGKVWKMEALRLEPGILENGKIKDRGALLEALSTLKQKLTGKDRAKKANVVVCLSSVATYTQVFPLPMVQNQNLEEAVQLNMQMASPLETGESYSGWQLVGRNEKTLQLEILSAFIERKTVDEMTDVLFEAGFLAMAVESRALALTRVLRQKAAGVDVSKPYLFVSIDNSGIDFLIIRNGALYFEYSNSWSDLTDEKGNVEITKFEAALAGSLKQVLNFYSQHWPEPVSAVILSAVALEAQAQAVMAANAPCPTAKLTLEMGQPISSEWLTALGCSLRGIGLQTKEQEVNLLGVDSQGRFHNEQLLSFMRFWRVVVPMALALLVATFVTADLFLVNTKKEIEARSDFTLNSAQGTEISALTAAAANFNQAVALAATAEKSLSPKNAVLSAVLNLAAEKGVTINSLSFQSFAAPVTLAGTSNAQDHVVAFKTALAQTPHVSSVNLPLTGVQTNGGTVSFSMTFIFTP